MVVFYSGGQRMYAEWMVLFNFFINLALLKFTQTMTQTNIPIWRLLLSAFCSAIVSILFFENPFMQVVSFILLLGLAYSFQWRSFWVQGRWLIIATLLVGGLLTALQPFLMVHSISIYILLCLSIVCSSLLAMKFGWMKKLQQLLQQRFIVPCTVHFAEQQWDLVAYIDTGNECIEPISRAPVHFVSFQTVQATMPSALQQSLLHWDESNPYELTMFSSTLQKYIRLVPISTVQQKTTLVPAFRVSLTINEKTYANHYIVFTKNHVHFPQQAHMIAHVVVLTNS